jgi:polar amino acid transport system substrate-binding protein
MLLLAAVPFPTLSSDAVRINDNDWPPYFFKGRENAPKGLGKELLEACIPKTGYEYRFSHLPIKRMWGSIQSGELDINIFSYRPDRESMLHYGKEPIYTASYRPVVRASSKLSIESIQDFRGLKLGHLAGLKYSPEFLSYVEGKVQNGQVYVSNSNQAILRMLLAGRIDVFVNTNDTVLWNAKGLGVGKHIKILDFDVQSGDYFVTLSKRSGRIEDKKRFLQIVDECLIDLKKTGQYAEILNRYVLQD